MVLAGVGKEYSPKGATAMVTDPRTGEILALANWPRVNANDVSAAPDYAKQNRAAGVSEGGRTGLTSVVVGVMFLLSLFISPLTPNDSKLPGYFHENIGGSVAGIAYFLLFLVGKASFILTYGSQIIGNVLSTQYPPHVTTVRFGPEGRALTAYNATIPEGLVIIAAYFIVTAILGLVLFERKEFT